MERTKEFWTEYLSGFTTTTTLPGHTKPVSFAINSEAASATRKKFVEISDTMTQSLVEFCRANQLTLYTLIQGAWAILLNAYSDSRDLVFGSAVSGRSNVLIGKDSVSVSFEDVVGLCINTLPVRIKYTSAMPVLQWYIVLIFFLRVLILVLGSSPYKCLKLRAASTNSHRWLKSNPGQISLRDRLSSKASSSLRTILPKPPSIQILQI